jgi:hypothetical protein
MLDVWAKLERWVAKPSVVQSLGTQLRESSKRVWVGVLQKGFWRRRIKDCVIKKQDGFLCDGRWVAENQKRWRLKLLKWLC